MTQIEVSTTLEHRPVLDLWCRKKLNAEFYVYHAVDEPVFMKNMLRPVSQNATVSAPSAAHAASVNNFQKQQQAN